MRKVVLYELVSLDGVAEAPDTFFKHWDEAMEANLGAVIAAQDTVVLGRRTYDEWSEFWPGSDIEPFGSFIRDVPKYVATSSPLDGPWQDARVIAADPAAAVTELKQLAGGDIGVHASISLARALLTAGVIDELRLVVAPVIAGGGRRLLEGLPPTRLESISTERSPAGYLLAGYSVAR